jgi:hypothetical protein
MHGVTYDTGALLAAERNDRRMWSLHAHGATSGLGRDSESAIIFP